MLVRRKHQLLARAVIHHPSEPHVSLEVCLILDGGSQKLYISERARNLLKLEPTGDPHLLGLELADFSD